MAKTKAKLGVVAAVAKTIKGSTKVTSGLFGAKTGVAAKAATPVRSGLSSPVKAPLVFNRPAALNVVEDPAKLQARSERRRHEDQLWAAFFKTESADARNELWVYYQSLVKYIAERQKSKLPESVDVQDLMSAGNLGLQDAINKFDPKVGVRFETYCVPRIRGAMLDSIRAADWVPRLIRNKNHKFDKLHRELEAELGREPSDAELGERMSLEPRKLDKLKRELDVKAQISLEGASDSGDEREVLRLEMLDDGTEFEPTREMQREEIRDMALRGLSANERTVVERYYFQGKSMKQIGDELMLSESRICQIHATVLMYLKRKFKAYEDSCSF